MDVDWHDVDTKQRELFANKDILSIPFLLFKCAEDNNRRAVLAYVNIIGDIDPKKENDQWLNNSKTKCYFCSLKLDIRLLLSIRSAPFGWAPDFKRSASMSLWPCFTD